MLTVPLSHCCCLFLLPVSMLEFFECMTMNVRSCCHGCESVQAQLAQKEAAAEKYRQLLEEARTELQSTINLHQEEKSKLLLQIHTQNGTLDMPVLLLMVSQLLVLLLNGKSCLLKNLKYLEKIFVFFRNFFYI